ncbi:FAD-binding oxidoreductase [Haloferax sp. DFSO60]|uniref:FAD-binding oxidoreductase n=1 Tax=Haloferax sp. DFSO60 TaxID=3388652 RepID=UPI00397C7E64
MSSESGTPGDRRKIGPFADDLSAFMDGFHGDVILPSDHRYEDARQIWNGMIDRSPAIIAQCDGTADVVDAVTFARNHDLQVSVRGGGHNVSGSAICEDGLVIDLSQMNAVFVDPETKRARVQGGATIGDVDRETQLFGLATALGVVSATGIAGLTLNGGIGHLRREYGLSLDNLASVEIVTADGTVRTASPDEHSDLFWAVRGGGGNFGVVTSFEYQLHEVGPEVNALFVLHPGDEATTALHAFHDYTKSAARESSVLAFTIVVPEMEEFPESAWGEPAVAFLGCYDGDRTSASEEFSALRDATTPIADLSGPMDYTTLQTMLDEDYPDGLRYYWKATYVEGLSDDIIDLIERYGYDSPSSLSTVDIWHLGGAISDVAPDETAFWHRKSRYMITFEANWEDPAMDDENVAWVRDGIAELRGMAGTSGAYGNFPGFGEDPSQTMFGSNYDRLAEIKAKYDPENLFNLNQNVLPAE